MTEVNLVLLEGLLPFHGETVEGRIDTADGATTVGPDLEAVDEDEAFLILSIHDCHFRVRQAEFDWEASQFTLFFNVSVHKPLIAHGVAV